MANHKQEEETLLSDMEVTGQAFEDMQDQNSRLIQQLREKDDANFKLMSERIKSNQIARYCVLYCTPDHHTMYQAGQGGERNVHTASGYSDHAGGGTEPGGEEVGGEGETSAEQFGHGGEGAAVETAGESTLTKQ